MPFLSPPIPFRINFDSNEIDDLNKRLKNARWPKQDIIPYEAQNEQLFNSFGPNLNQMKEWTQGWLNYNWREREEHFNTFNHFMVEIENLNIHFLHHKSTQPNAIPLILCHGWPGSFLEFLDVIPLLTNPISGQAFHLIIPSQPGFAFSDGPNSSRWGMEDTARIFDQLMTGLGYEKYAAQGGDWGSITARILGSLHSDHCIATHLNFCPATAPGLLSFLPPRTLLKWFGWTLSTIDLMRATRSVDFMENGSAYYAIQSSTPRTAAYGLNDSPIGLLAWIGEKMGPYILAIEEAKIENSTLNRIALYDTLTLYYLTNSIGTSFLPYSLNKHFSTFLNDPKYFLPNFALSIFPDEIAITSRAFVEKTGELNWYEETKRGGHFASLEEPKIFSEQLQKAFTVIWKP